MKGDAGLPPVLSRTGLRLARRERGAAGGGAAAWLEVELMMLCDGALKHEKLEIPLYLPDGAAMAKVAIVAAVVASALVLCIP